MLVNSNDCADAIWEMPKDELIKLMLNALLTNWLLKNEMGNDDLNIVRSAPALSKTHSI